VTQHPGGGKANQHFLRGFNLDHGTDFATSVAGMPVSKENDIEYFYESRSLAPGSAIFD
jgi:hypothetical protein